MSRVQDSEVGDGTTSVTVLVSELIREAEKLVDMRIHPQTVIVGWRQASKVALQALENSALSHVEEKMKDKVDLICVTT